MLDFLQKTFGNFDHSVFVFMNGLNNGAGGFLTPLFKVVTFLGEGGILFFLLGAILMLFSKTRKMGMCIFGAVGLGAIFTNIILKDLIARPRPFLSNPEYTMFWQTVGSPKEDGFSFPSGHMTAITAFATAFLATGNKKWSWTGYIAVILMGFARVYLIAHYASDVLAGIIVGAIAGGIAMAIAQGIYRYCESHTDKKFCRFVLDFDIYHSIGNRKEPLPESDTNPIVEEVPELTEDDTKSLYDKQKEIEKEMEEKAKVKELDASDLSHEELKKADEILNRQDVDALSGNGE